MAWSDLTITRNNIDSFEKQTFSGLNVTTGNTVLNIDEKDNLVLDEALKQLESDVSDSMSYLVNDETFASEDDLLDAIYAADSKGLLKSLLTYKFLEIWFKQDATHVDSKTYKDAVYYYNKYTHYLPINLQRIAGRLSKPRRNMRYQFISQYD